jgi:hypothetical protein
LGRGDIIYIVFACKYNEQMLKIKIIVSLFYRINLFRNKATCRTTYKWKPPFCKI